MTRRPVQDVRIWNIQDRRVSTPQARKPWVVRWVVDGQVFSLSYRTQAEADRYRSRLLIAQQDGERFDLRTGEPVSWSPSADEIQVHAWVRKWLADEWLDWAPRTRQSMVESLARFVPLVCEPKAPEPPARLHAYLGRTLRPAAEIDSTAEEERWLNRHVLSLGELGRELLADVERRLGLGVKGQPLAAATASRYRKHAHSCIRRAVELERIAADPWPPTPKGRSRRKALRKRKAVDVRLLPDPTTMAAIIRAIRSHQPGSRNYEVMTAVTYYAGLRPSETAMLRPRALHLPEEGWGAIYVVEADDGWDEPAEPKTGERTVPIPPELVIMLRAWVDDHRFGPDDLLFRTRNGKRPTQSNWGRALKRACRSAKFRELTPYDGRHACATTWLRAGMPLGAAAQWLGHSVETLVTYYVGALEGDDIEAQKRIDAAMAPSRHWMAETERTSSRALPANSGKTRSTTDNYGERTRHR